MRYRFNNTDLTDSSVQAARQWYHDNACAIASEREANGKDSQFWRDAAVSALTIGKPQGERVSVAFLQRAYFIQTGESVALLP